MELISLVKKYGTYTDIPDGIKNAILSCYRDDEIKTAVANLLFGKCIYCESYIESVSYPHIEHFYPKSIYPKFTFKWSNLFPSCTKCNIKKGDLDTKINKIVNPEKEDPEQHFVFRELKIEVSPNSPDSTMSENTIKYCDLQRVSLCRDYSSILIALYEIENTFKDTIAHYQGLVLQVAKLKIANQMREALDNLKNQCSPQKPHAGFTRHFFRNCNTFQQAVQIVNSHSRDLGLQGVYVIP